MNLQKKKEEEEEEEEEEEDEEEEDRHFFDICPGTEPEKYKPLSQTSSVPNVIFFNDENNLLQ